MINLELKGSSLLYLGQKNAKWFSLVSKCFGLFRIEPLLQQKLGKETGVQQMQDSMLNTSNVNIDRQSLSCLIMIEWSRDVKN